MSSLAWLLLLVSTVAQAAQAEEVFPEERFSQATWDKGWALARLADAHLVLGEYHEGIEAAKSAFRILRDLRILTHIALTYEDWGAHVSDPKEAVRLHQQAAFFYERVQLLLPTVPRGAPIGWTRRTLERRLPPLKEALAEAEEDANDATPPPAQRLAELEAELARIRDELSKERSLRTGLEQAVRVLASRRVESCAGP